MSSTGEKTTRTNRKYALDLTIKGLFVSLRRIGSQEMVRKGRCCMKTIPSKSLDLVTQEEIKDKWPPTL
jgi:hypothetical protein